MFTSLASAIAAAQKEGKSLSQVALEAEALDQGRPVAEIRDALRRALVVMRGAVEQGLVGDLKSASGLVGGDAAKVHHSKAGPFAGSPFSDVLARALAVQEVNAAMDVRYRETAGGGLAATPTGRRLARERLVHIKRSGAWWRCSTINRRTTPPTAMRRFPALSLAVVLAVALAVALAAVPAATRAQGAITGTVYDSLHVRGPLRDVSVMLTELNRVTTTDARGRFRFDSVPDGRYRVTFFYSSLDSLGIGGPVSTVTVSRGLPAETYLATPSPPELYRRLCGPPKDPSVGAVLGRVRDVDTHQPIASAVVETFWAEFEYMQRNFKRHLFKATTRTGPEGVFILCGVPSDVPLDLTARVGLFQAGPVTVTHGRNVVALRDLSLSRTDSAARADTMILVRDSSRIPTGSGVVRGVLQDRTGRPVPDSPVRIVADARETRSGPDGSFVLTGVPAGTRTVEARAIGYGPATAAVDVPTGGSVSAQIMFDRRAQELKAITIVGQRPRRDIEGFAVRTKEGLGRYITDDDLKKRPVSRIGDALLRAGNVTYDLTQIGPELKMRATGSMKNDSRCVPNFFLDGMFIPAPEPNMRQTMLQAIETMVIPDDVRGIEVYSSLGATPPEFDRSNGCGSVVIWTR